MQYLIILVNLKIISYSLIIMINQYLFGIIVRKSHFLGVLKFIFRGFRIQPNWMMNLGKKFRFRKRTQRSFY